MAQAATAAEPAAAREALAFDQLEPSERVALARWLTVHKQWRDPTAWQTAADYDDGIVVVDLQLHDGSGMIASTSFPARYRGEAQRYALLNAARKNYGNVGHVFTFGIWRCGLQDDAVREVDFRTNSFGPGDIIFCTPVDEVEVTSARTREERDAEGRASAIDLDAEPTPPPRAAASPLAPAESSSRALPPVRTKTLAERLAEAEAEALLTEAEAEAAVSQGAYRSSSQGASSAAAAPAAIDLDADDADAAPPPPSNPPSEPPSRCPSPPPATQGLAADAAECIICTDPLADGLSITKCGHVFHAHCLQQWFESGGKVVCPLCKTQRRNAGGFVRALEQPRPLSAAEANEAAELAAAPGSPKSKLAAADAALRKAADEGRALDEKRGAAEERWRRKRPHVDRLRTELVRARLQLDAAGRKADEQEAQLGDAAAAEAHAALTGGGAGGEAAAPGSPAALLDERRVVEHRKLVQSLSQQLLWRCAELKSLRAKVAEAEAEATLARLDAQRAERRVSTE